MGKAERNKRGRPKKKVSENDASENSQNNKRLRSSVAKATDAMESPRQTNKGKISNSGKTIPKKGNKNKTTQQIVGVNNNATIDPNIVGKFPKTSGGAVSAHRSQVNQDPPETEHNESVDWDGDEAQQESSDEANAGAIAGDGISVGV